MKRWFHSGAPVRIGRKEAMYLYLVQDRLQKKTPNRVTTADAFKEIFSRLGPEELPVYEQLENA
jgi:hypothetical protein